MALGALTVAHRLKLRVPEDLSVVGFDDTPAGLTAWPPLTTVSQPLEAMGSAVIDALAGGAADTPHFSRSEEHTSELQSLMRISYAVFCLKQKKEQTK